MSKEYEQQILDWEQEIVRAEKTIQAVCEAYVGNPDGPGQTTAGIAHAKKFHRHRGSSPGGQGS